MLLDLMASGRSFMQRASSRDLKLSPTDCHGLMLGFTLDWGFKPHSKGDCKGIIMVVFFGGVLVEKGIMTHKPDGPLMSSVLSGQFCSN